MSRICKKAVICIVVTCWLPALLEATKDHISSSTAGSTYSSMDGYNSTFTVEKDNITLTKNEGEQNVAQKWKNIVVPLNKLFTIIYNESMPFISHVNDNLNISRNCKRDLMKMLTGVKEFKYWAIKMLDSFGKIPVGFFSGSINVLGDYNECLGVDVPGFFKGQYCNLDIILPRSKRKPFTISDNEVPELKELVKPDEYPIYFSKCLGFFQFINLRNSICVPSTCLKEELQLIANEVVKRMNLSFGLHIPNCEVLNKEVKFDRIEITIMVILGFLILLVISSTVVDVYLENTSNTEEYVKNNISLPKKYFLCFSLHSNVNRLFKPDTKKDSIKIFHGMRVLHTLWVILVHTGFYLNYQATGSLTPFYKHKNEIAHQVVANGFINVQSFFFMSGTLHSFRAMKMKEKINIKMHILRRIFRLAPAFILVIACVILIPHLGSGPVWKETIRDRLTEKCRAKWWTNLLFINNFNKNEDMCLQWLWYIPVDFQLYILSLLVVIPMRSNPELALTINCFIMIGCMIISAAFHVFYKLTPMLVIAFSNPEDISYFLERGYFRTYLHSSSVCIGLAVGYFLANRPAKLHIPLKISAPLWLASACACFTVLFGVHEWNGGHIPGIAVSTLYAAFSKILWSASIAWITIACTTENGGIVAKFLNLPIFVPLARLCYMVYLMHSIIHFMYIGSTRLIIPMDLRTLVYTYCGTVFLSFSLAFVLTLIFELPFTAIEQLIFPKETSERTEHSVKCNDKKPEGALTQNGDLVGSTNSIKKTK